MTKHQWLGVLMLGFLVAHLANVLLASPEQALQMQRLVDASDKARMLSVWGAIPLLLILLSGILFVFAPRWDHDEKRIFPMVAFVATISLFGTVIVWMPRHEAAEFMLASGAFPSWLVVLVNLGILYVLYLSFKRERRR